MDFLYKECIQEQFDKGERGAVVLWQDGIVFRCPCNERQVYVSSSIHGINYDINGLLTLNGSCGYHEAKNLGRKQNWCHFFIKAGRYEMCSDSECPGANL